MIIDIMTIILWIGLLIYWGFILFREDKVFKLRHQIILDDFDESMKAIKEGRYDEQVDNYRKLPSVWRMVFSFKPIKKESWIKDDTK